MACRGYFLALGGPCAARLLAEDGNDRRIIDGLDYLTTYLADVTAFYQRAARAGWATVFTADQ